MQRPTADLIFMIVVTPCWPYSLGLPQASCSCTVRVLLKLHLVIRMTILAFSLGGVSANAGPLGGSSRFAHFGIWHGGELRSLVEVTQEGDETFGGLSNKFIHYGWMSCNTTQGGEGMLPDADGRNIPHSLVDKHINITVDCGRILEGTSLVMVSLEICEGRGRAKGPTLYKLEDYEMSIWSGRLANDGQIRGYASMVGGSQQSRDQLARNLITGNH